MRSIFGTSAKRGGGAEALDVDEIEIPSPAEDDDTLLLVNEALEKLATLDPRKAELVKLSLLVGRVAGAVGVGDNEVRP